MTEPEQHPKSSLSSKDNAKPSKKSEQKKLRKNKSFSIIFEFITKKLKIKLSQN